MTTGTLLDAALVAFFFAVVVARVFSVSVRRPRAVDRRRIEWRSLLEILRSRTRRMIGDALSYIGAVHQGATAECVVCFDRKFLSTGSFPTLRCCASNICWKCLYEHVKAVISDARPELHCPCFPCRASLRDTLVREALSRQSRWALLDFGAAQGRLLRQYERWSVKVGLAQVCQVHAEEVVECPGLDCDVMWVMPQGLRKAKADHEPVHPWSPRAWSFFYSTWSPGDGSGQGACAPDPRRVWCDHCEKAYCLVCRRQWEQPRKGYRPTAVDLRFQGPRHKPPMDSHAGKPCATFGSRSLRPDALEYTIAAEAVGAKCCPRCSIRIQRTSGCNQIRCPRCCLYWCFVCEEPWSHKHYACRDRDGDTYKRRDPASQECSVM